MDDDGWGLLALAVAIAPKKSNRICSGRTTGSLKWSVHTSRMNARSVSSAGAAEGAAAGSLFDSSTLPVMAVVVMAVAVVVAVVESADDAAAKIRQMG